MYRHLALVLVTPLWLLLHALTTTALAIAPQRSAITPFNQTQGESTFNLTLSQSLINETLTPWQNLIPYRVPNSPTTLLFHSFGPTIPANEILPTIAFAIGIAFDFIGEGRGRKPIASGFFVYTQGFPNHDEVELTVGDFREVGRSMTYHALFDVLRGIGEFMLLPGQKTQELEFEVEVQGLGYVGTGHVDLKSVATSTF